VMSATHNTLGAVGRNWRWTRSSATRTPGTRIVVRPRFLGTRPEIPAWRMRRSTRLRPDADAPCHAQLGLNPWGAIDLAVLLQISRICSVSHAS
jgi:hypothetical protein